MKLMLIDGNSIVNRAFYGVHMLNAPDGTPTNAVYGFLNIYRKLLDNVKPDAVAVTFDLPKPTFRHEMYSDYKGTRKGMPEELRQQMPILKQVLEAMGVKRYELEGWEADDLIGSIAAQCEASGWTCEVVTGDKDSFQLISEGTSIRHVKSRMGQTEVKVYDVAAFREEYGFDPPLMVDLKALMGDTSDNIPGVPGVGEKTAMNLVQAYGSLENVLNAMPEMKDSLRKKLESGRDSAMMSYDLATIRKNAPVVFDPAANMVTAPNNDALYELFHRLGFRKLIDSYGLTAPAAEKAETAVFEANVTVVEVETEADVAALRAALTGLAAIRMRDGIVALDTDNGNTGFIIRESSPVFRSAMEIISDAKVRKAGHDIKDTLHQFLDMGLSIEGWEYDTALAAYLLDATASGYDLSHLTEDCCGFTIMENSDENGQLSMLEDDTKLTARLLSEAAAVLALRDWQMPKLEEAGMTKLLSEIEVPLCPVLAEMEHEGFMVDRQELKNFGDSLTDAISVLEERIYAAAGESFNINSPKQLGTILFEKLMLPSGKKTKTGWSTNAEVLEGIADKHPIVGDVLEYRMLTKLKSTYTDGLLKVIASDGRIHTNFQMTVTATGRLSSTEPNLQNIPVRKELGSQIRRMFVAAPGKVLVDADYSQIELRLLAHISGDENMINAFCNREDIHTVTASQVFGVPVNQVTKTMRSNAKAVNFGIVYGISSWSLARDIGVLPAEAKAYMDAYLEKYHGVRQYMKDIVEKARADGYVATLYGRRRTLPELRSPKFAMRSFGERVALNMPIQGTAADIIKLAMVNVYRRLKAECPQAKLILQVHDELLAECPEEDADRVKAIISEEMQSVVQFSVPLTAEANSGHSWAEAH